MKISRLQFFSKCRVDKIIEDLHAEADAKIATEAKQLDAARVWYAQTFANVLSSVLPQLDPSAASTTEMCDFALLLRAEQNAPLPVSMPFDLAQLVSGARGTVSRIYPAIDDVFHVGLRPQMPLHWSGHGDIIEALLRHLMLLTLGRSQQGIISLRLDAESEPSMQGKHWLRVHLEDSGTPIQRGQLRDWLHPVRNHHPSPSGNYDLSWLLVGRLFHYLGGGVNAESGPETGLRLIGWIPLEIAP